MINCKFGPIGCVDNKNYAAEWAKHIGGVGPLYVGLAVAEQLLKENNYD